MGRDEQLYLLSKGYTSDHVVGEGGETVNFWKPGDKHVTRVFRRRSDNKLDNSPRPIDERSKAVVLAGKYGFSPPATKVSESIVEQDYIDFDGGELKKALERGDYSAVRRTVSGVKRRVHNRGLYLRDPATINLSDPAITGGYVTVDASQFGHIPEGEETQYALWDFAKTHRDADSAGQSGLFLSAVRDEYGDYFAKQLKGLRSWEKRTGGKLDKPPLTPLEYREWRLAA